MIVTTHTSPYAMSSYTIEGHSHGVLIPTHASKSQHGDKVVTFEPQEVIKIWLFIIKVGS